MERYLEILKKGSQELGVNLTEAQLRQLDLLLGQLKFFNTKFNLTTIVEPVEIVKKHFLDSLSVVKAGYDLKNKNLIDIGAGAGFPGLVLKIAFPGLGLTLLEANKKKCLFLEYMAGKLRLDKVSIVNDRAEDFGQGAGREQFEAAITRALSSLSVNLEYAIPFLKQGGIYLAMKAGLEKEPSTENACKQLACETVKQKKVDVPYLEAERNIIIFKKTSSTNTKYPRRAGKPNKSPL